MEMNRQRNFRKKPMSNPHKRASRSMKQDDREQSRAFIEKAREIGCDENSAAADELIGRLAKMPPKPHAKTRTKAKDHP
jgi:hypothetical protein